jgi:MFS family permease
VPPGGVPRKLTVTRVAAARTSYLSRQLLRKVGAASRAQGASEAGLTPLIWLNAVNMAADAMIAVCLAGTIFFSAATSQQRANVALYLLITMAPFALVAPVIGPLLDRLHHGRRWALAGTLLGRALLAYIMASNFHNFGLYPAAFGTLVLAKAYGVLRAAAVPRVMPHQMTLVSANARLSLFGLGAAALAGVLAGGLIKISGSYPLALMLTAAVFVAGAVLAFRLPRHVDSPERGHAPQPVTSGRRGRFALDSQVVLALRATAAVRGLSGFLTLFMVFLIQSRLHGATAAFELGAIVAAAGAGSMIGTTAGARLRLARPDIVVLAAIGASAGTCVLAAVTYGIQSAVLLALVVGAANSLAKLSLDAIIQREVPEYLTASAFARSETMLQLAWVFGGGLGIVLPSRGTVGFSVAAALLVGAFAYIVISRRNLAPGPAPRAGRLGADGQPAG